MIKNILLIISLILLGLYGISVVPTLPERMQIAVTVSIIGAIVLAVIYPKIDFDFKFIIIVLFGYILAGKRFAYLSPFEPVFIGEIVLAVAFIMVLGRVLTKGLWGKLFDTPLHIAIWLLLIYGALHLYLDFPRYGIVAIKDSATIYYALFFIVIYLIFQNPSNFQRFEKLIPYILIAGLVAFFMLGVLPRLGINIREVVLFAHKDAYIGAAIGGFVGLYFYSLKHKSTVSLIWLIVFTILLTISAPTSIIFALIISILMMIFIAKQYHLCFLAIGGLAIASIAIAIILASGGDLATRLLTEFDSMNLAEINKASFKGSTSGWRLAWWSAIWDETMATSPLWGLGFGADLGSEFTLRYYGGAAGEFGNQAFGAARYPHNVLFTMVGRLGLIGMVLFLLYITMLLRCLFKFCNIYCRGNIKNIDIKNIGVACFVGAGIANAFVQCTYEAPYAAIPHWIMVAYIAVKVKNYKKTINH